MNKIIKKIIENKKKQKKYLENQARYKSVIKKLKDKIKSGKKIKVAFFVMHDSITSYKPLYEKMLEDKHFDPIIIIIPDISRGEEHLKRYFNQTYKSLKKEYKNILKGYDLKTKKFIDYSDNIDMVNLSTPYEGMSHKFFEIKYLLKKDILPFYISYSFSVTRYFQEKIKFDSYSLFWKIFIENKYCLKELKKYQKIKGKNAVITGYCKMDKFEKFKEIKKRNKKTIIISPHHTIIDWKPLMISNFLTYSDFFLELPQKYPNINFIFRPHPLLITQLTKPEIWGKEKTKKYFKKIESYPNTTYSKGGRYFDIFKNSDGIINDSASFLAEYLFTEKPQCYILKNKRAIKKWFMPIGQKCLKYCYKSYSEKDIINYIENIVLKNQDPLREKRIAFVNKELKINYPNSSLKILNYIKQTLNIK